MKSSRRHPRTPAPSRSGRRLVVTAERREQPDWDRYVAALLALAMRRVEERAAANRKGERG